MRLFVTKKSCLLNGSPLNNTSCSKRTNCDPIGCFHYAYFKRIHHRRTLKNIRNWCYLSYVPLISHASRKYTQPTFSSCTRLKVQRLLFFARYNAFFRKPVFPSIDGGERNRNHYTCWRNFLYTRLDRSLYFRSKTKFSQITASNDLCNYQRRDAEYF